MSWTLQLVGKPYSLTGQGPDSFNCWALVRRALLIGHGIEVPEMALDTEPGWRAVQLRTRMARDWSIVARPKAADILAMVGSKRDLHVGLFLDSFRVLHTSADAGEARVQRFEDFPFLGFGKFEIWRRA